MGKAASGPTGPTSPTAAVTSLTVAVLGGGRSSEHDVSLASAASIREGLRDGGHDPIAIEIGRDGVWRRDGEVLSLEPGRGLDGADVVFPALHGPFGEDGTVQGLLECLGVPYVGAGVLCSALCMDKVTFKELMGRHGVPQVDYRAVRVEQLRSDPEATRSPARAARAAGVRQAGSARLVGGDRAGREPASLAPALEIAFEHDPLAIVEAAASGLEVECSVVGNRDPIASQPGEIVLASGETAGTTTRPSTPPGGMRLIVPPRAPGAHVERDA